MSVDHYENFPVASWLVPRTLRPAVAAIYWFARRADDIADEGDAAPDVRLAQLDAFEGKLDRIERSEPPEEEPFGLTPRERQVLTLVSEGRTNREIGDTLYMAEKTASVHVSRILSKLGVRSRTEAAAVAHRLGLDAASETGRPAAGA